MVFSETTTLQGIIQECERLCHLGKAGISGNADLLKEFTHRSNEAMRVIWTWIFTAESGWQYDDNNQTDLPQAKTNLTSGTSLYALPSTALTVKRIEILDDNDNFYTIQPITEQELRGRAVDEFMETNGTPEYYRLLGNTIELFPAPNYSKTSGLKVYFDRDISEFASTDTDKEPGFASIFHQAVPVGASLNWSKINSSNTQAIQTLQIDWQAFENNIKNFYNKRFKNHEPRHLGRRYQSFR